MKELIQQFDGTTEKEIRGIFASIFILQNRLQTIFDKADEQLTLKQFMLLTMIRYSDEQTTFTHLGRLLGSSRQNVKKLAQALETKGFLTISHEATNKKNTTLILTAKAQHYADDVFQLHTTKLQQLFADYSAEELHTFYQLITKLYAGVEREDQTND